MTEILVTRPDGEVKVVLLPHKDGSGWSFVNLTKGHICPCKFNSEEDGMKDLNVQPNVESYRVFDPGCEYCQEDSEGFRKVLGAFSIIDPFHRGEYYLNAGKAKPRKINFCPMCGRKL